MTPQEHAVQKLAQAVADLAEPYRGNTVQWLETCMQRPVDSLEEDLRVFLDDLHPVVRDSFLQYTHLLLTDALRYFGRDERRPMTVRTVRPTLAQILSS